MDLIPYNEWTMECDETNVGRCIEDYLISKGYRHISAAPGACFFFGEHAVVHGQPAVLMPIPLYTYVGVRERPRHSDTLIDFYEILLRREDDCATFGSIRIDTEIRGHVGAVFESFEQKIGKSPDNLSIAVMSEVPPYAGLNGSGSFVAATIVGLGVELGLVEWKEISNDLQRMKMADLAQKPEITDSLFPAMWSAEKVFHGPDGSGAGVWASLVGANDGIPLLYLKFSDSRIFSCSLGDIVDKNMKSHLRDMLWGQYGFCLLDTRVQRRTSGVLGVSSKGETFSLRSSSIGAFVRKAFSTFQNLPEDYSLSLKSPLLRFLMEDTQSIVKRTKQNIWKILGTISLYGANFFVNCDFQRFSQMANLNQSILHFAGFSIPEIDRICDLARSHNVTAKLTGAGCGGHVVGFGKAHAVESLSGDVKDYPTTFLSTKNLEKFVHPVRVLR